MIDVDVRTIGARAGEEIAVSDWLEVTQARINQFAEATGDHQWIHVDPARAAAELPSCVAKQVTRPVRNREARVTEPHLA